MAGESVRAIQGIRIDFVGFHCFGEDSDPFEGASDEVCTSSSRRSRSRSHTAQSGERFEVGHDATCDGVAYEKMTWNNSGKK